MSKRIKHFRLWLSNHVPVPLLLTGTVVVVLLSLNEDVSLSRNYSYLQKIVSLKKEIRLNRDSAEYYRRKSSELTTSPAELEQIAREQYHMQKPDEEVYMLQ